MMKILTDTSIWIDHFRKPDPALSGFLSERAILLHPFVLGEIALGRISGLSNVMGALRLLPQALVAGTDAVIGSIEKEGLGGSGIGYVDAHLVASTQMMPEATLWTRDKRLRAVAERLAIATPNVD
jgi:predicted nucleic acid-binding protein